MEEMEVQSSVPIQLTTSRTTLVLVCLSMETAELCGTHSRLCPSTASSLSPHRSFPSLLAGLSGTTNNTWTGSGLRSVPGSAPPKHRIEVRELLGARGGHLIRLRIQFIEKGGLEVI